MYFIGINGAVGMKDSKHRHATLKRDLSMGCQFKHREICRQLHDLRIVMRKELRAKRMGPLHPPAGGAPPAGAAGGDSSSDTASRV